MSVVRVIGRVLFYFLVDLVLLLAIPIVILWQPAPFSAYTAVQGGASDGVTAVEPSSEDCQTPDFPDEPPCNPSLARSPWPASHRGPYSQGSSPLPGLDADRSYLAQHVNVGGLPLMLNFSSSYPDGGVAIWATPINGIGYVVKFDHDAFEIIDVYDPVEQGASAEGAAITISGAYNVLDNENRLIVGRQRAIEFYGDSVPGDRFSRIALLGRLTVPESFFCGADDLLVGLSLTYDGYVVFVTQHGRVGVLPNDPDRLSVDELVRYDLIDCLDEPVVKISNNLALDETGGLYIVTSEEVVRLQWDGVGLAEVWRTAYESGDGGSSLLRLGPGSGSTPSLMGTAADDDKFVVITDGQELMHLVLMWRDEIPADWEPIAPEVNERIACQVPVRFGDPNGTGSLSEQSVLVRGYATVHVNNQLSHEPDWWQGMPQTLRTAFAAGAGGQPEMAPYGIERIDWNPDTRTCETVWVNQEASLPNGIPTMSAATNMIYGVGQREGVWGLELIDFSSGESRLFIEGRQQRCEFSALQQFEPRGLRLVAAARLVFNPRACENAFYAATEVGPDRTVYTGTFLGVSKYASAGQPADR